MCGDRDGSGNDGYERRLNTSNITEVEWWSFVREETAA